MTQNQKRDANGRFVRTKPDWEMIAEDCKENLRKSSEVIAEKCAIIGEIRELAEKHCLIRASAIKKIIGAIG